MNKQARYWAIGIIAAIAVILAVWAAAAARSNRDKGGAETDHAGMDHGAPDTSAASGGLGGYLKEQDVIMAAMMEAMEGVGQSGNASIDFLKGMVPHHESAVEMAESYLKHGGNDETLKKIANDIIDTQTKEIEQMNAMIEELEDAGRNDAEKEAAYLEEYQKMFSAHHMSHGSGQTPGSVDAAFSQGMIEHHQMAVDMAKAILNHSDEEDVKGLAQTMIDAQEREIGEMRAVLDKTGK